MHFFRVERAREPRVAREIGKLGLRTWRRSPGWRGSGRRRRRLLPGARPAVRTKSRTGRKRSVALRTHVAVIAHHADFAMAQARALATGATGQPRPADFAMLDTAPSIGIPGEQQMRDASLPITLIVVGIIGLVWYFRWLPDIDWIISLGFIAGGVAALVIDGINKNSVVTGPFLIAVGIAWALRDRYRVSWSLIIPALLVLLGALMLLARNPKIPTSGRGRRSLNRHSRRSTRRRLRRHAPIGVTLMATLGVPVRANEPNERADG